MLVVALATSATADDASDAKATAAEAENLATAGKYDEAASKYRSAHALDPRPEYLCNVGVVYQRAKRLDKAQLYLGECLVRGTMLDPKYIDLVRKTLGAVEAKLRVSNYTPVDIVVEPSGATLQIAGFDRDEKLVGSRVLWLAFGKHKITASADGYRAATQEIEASSPDRQQVRIELEKIMIRPQTIIVEKPVVEVQPSRAPAIATSIATGVLGIGAVLAWVSARGYASDAGSSTITKDRYDDLVDSARGWQKASWGLGGLAIVGAGVSGYLWYRSTRTKTVEVAPTEGGATVSLHARF